MNLGAVISKWVAKSTGGPPLTMHRVFLYVSTLLKNLIYFGSSAKWVKTPEISCTPWKFDQVSQICFVVVITFFFFRNWTNSLPRIIEKTCNSKIVVCSFDVFLRSGLEDVSVTSVMDRAPSALPVSLINKNFTTLLERFWVWWNNFHYFIFLSSSNLNWVVLDFHWSLLPCVTC